MTVKTLSIVLCFGVFSLATPLHTPVAPQPDTASLVEKLKAREQQKELECLAKNIFYEAAQESYEGKLAVGTVTMNRVKSAAFPKTVCSVVYQRGSRGCQFSWTCATKRAKMNAALYAESLRVAEQIMVEGILLKSIKNALYFHNTSIRPNWTFATPIKQIGNHIFYAPKRKDA